MTSSPDDATVFVSGRSKLLVVPVNGRARIAHGSSSAGTLAIS